MGSTQMLMLVLVLIIIAIAIFIAVRLFEDQAASANLERMTLLLTELGSRAQKYYHVPRYMAGGSNSFVGITADDQGLKLLTGQPVNAEGSYSVLIAGTATEVTLQGVGVEDGDRDGINCTAVLHVTANDMQLTIVNR
jgi:hypothetical protein